MWKNAIVATVTLLFGLAMFLFSALAFLAPYKHVLIDRYGVAIGLYFLVLGVNLYAAFFLLTRALLLKDTGTKLVHLEKQLRGGSLPRELGEQLARE